MRKTSGDIINQYQGISKYYRYICHNLYGDRTLPLLAINKYEMRYAMVALISNFFMVKKEELIDNKGNLNYSPKIIDKCLEEQVELIAKKEDNKYIIDSYVTTSASEIIAVIRNKFAHGDYKVDIVNDQVIFNKDQKEIKISIDKLSAFLYKSICNLIAKPKANEMKRIIMENAATKAMRVSLKNLDDVEKALNYTRFNIYNLKKREGEISDELLDDYMKLMRIIKRNKEMQKSSNREIQNFRKKALEENATLIIAKSKIKNENTISKVKAIINNNKEFYKLTITEQIILITNLALEIEENEYNRQTVIVGNLLNNKILSTMYENNTTNFNKILNSLTEEEKMALSKARVEQLASVLIAEFNALYTYPLDKTYVKSKYSLNRENELDFSELDLTTFQPSTISINENPYIDSENELISNEKEIITIRETLKRLKKSYNIVKDKNDRQALQKIKNMIDAKELYLDDLLNLYIDKKINYELIKEDYNENEEYFINRAIIEGIRNSIAHGNITIDKFSSLENISEMYIIFKNIHDDILHFELKVKIKDFEMLFGEKNLQVISDFIINKNEKEKMKVYLKR